MGQVGSRACIYHLSSSVIYYRFIPYHHIIYKQGREIGDRHKKPSPVVASPSQNHIISFYTNYFNNGSTDAWRCFLSQKARKRANRHSLLFDTRPAPPHHGVTLSDRHFGVGKRAAASALSPLFIGQRGDNWLQVSHERAACACMAVAVSSQGVKLRGVGCASVSALDLPCFIADL